MTYQRILVPFDGSKFAKKALEHAVDIAKNNDAIIHLCTIITTGGVIPPGSLLGLVRESARGTLQKRLLQASKIETDHMQNEQIKFCKSRGIKACPKVAVNGNVAEQILVMAKKKSADLIVIGSQGLHGVAKLKSLGSVSRKVSEYARCPVLIVR